MIYTTSNPAAPREYAMEDSGDLRELRGRVKQLDDRTARKALAELAAHLGQRNNALGEGLDVYEARAREALQHYDSTAAGELVSHLNKNPPGLARGVFHVFSESVAESTEDDKAGLEAGVADLNTALDAAEEEVEQAAAIDMDTLTIAAATVAFLQTRYGCAFKRRADGKWTLECDFAKRASSEALLAKLLGLAKPKRP